MFTRAQAPLTGRTPVGEGGPVDLLGDAVDVVGDDVVEVDRERLTVAHPVPAHQIGDQQETVVAGGAYLTQLLG